MKIIKHKGWTLHIPQRAVNAAQRSKGEILRKGRQQALSIKKLEIKIVLPDGKTKIFGIPKNVWSHPYLSGAIRSPSTLHLRIGRMRGFLNAFHDLVVRLNDGQITEAQFKQMFGQLEQKAVDYMDEAMGKG